MNKGATARAALRQAALEAVFDRLEMGVFLTSEAGVVSWLNRAATRLLQASDGLLPIHGRLRARNPSDQRKLQHALSTPTHAIVRVSRLSQRPGYQVHVHRLWAEQVRGRDPVAVLVSAPDQPGLSKHSLMNAYDLTDTEARVAIAVVHSHGLAEAARGLGLSVNTVKSMLQRVYAKTETHSQAQLTRLLMAAPSGPLV